MPTGNIGLAPFETPKIPKTGSGLMAKASQFLSGICQEGTKIALDSTARRDGFGQTQIAA